jgi:DUF1680 family protein
VSNPGGFLGKRFAANLSGRLKDPMLSEEFIRRHERKDHFEWFWSGEQLGKWFDAAAYSALIARDAGLLERIEALLARLEKTQEEDGAVSITLRRNRVPARGMELYEYYYVLHGLLVLHELLGSEKALAMACRLGDYILKTWGTEPGQFPLAGRFPGNGHGGGEGTLILEPIVLLGLRAGQDRYVEWGERALRKWDDWLAAYPESRFTCGYTAMRQFAAGEKEVYELRPGIHAHTFHMTLLGIAALSDATGRPEYRDTFLGCTDRLAEEWIFLTGGMSSGEGYLPRRYYHPRGDIEVCPQHTWMLMLAQAYRWTGQACYLAEIERDLFNHFLAAQLADGTNWSYMTPLAGQSQEPEKPNCCNASGQRIAGRMPVYLYGLREGQAAVLLYTASQANFDLPGGNSLSLSQETDFPSTGEVILRVEPSRPAAFPLHLRIPPYASGATVQVGGGDSHPAPAGDFLVLEREWQPGDLVRLSLPFPVTCQANQDVAALTRGPLVYAYFQKAQPDDAIYLGRRGRYPDDIVLQIDPERPGASIEEKPAPENLLGPALWLPGAVSPKAPMFATPAANRQLDGRLEEPVVLLPFANQGALRGDFSVFLSYKS